jgi:hypothetical protein
MFMSEENSYGKIKKFIERLTSRIIKSTRVFYVWKHLRLIRDTNTYGEIAFDNIKKINRIPAFLASQEYIHAVFFVIEIAKFFDHQDRTLTLEKFENCALQEQPEIKIQDFINDNLDRGYIENLKETYEGLKQKDIEMIRHLRKQNDGIIKTFKSARHSLVHDFVKMEEVQLPSFEKIEAFLCDIQEIINIVSQSHLRSTTAYSHVEGGVQEDIALLFKLL